MKQKPHEVCKLINDATDVSAFLNAMDTDGSKDTLDYTRTVRVRKEGRIFDVYVSATVRVECKGEGPVPG